MQRVRWSIGVILVMANMAVAGMTFQRADAAVSDGRCDDPEEPCRCFDDGSGAYCSDIMGTPADPECEFLWDCL